MLSSMAGRAVTARARVAVQKRDVRIQAMATQRKAAAKSKAPAGSVGRTLWLPNTVRAGPAPAPGGGACAGAGACGGAWLWRRALAQIRAGLLTAPLLCRRLRSGRTAPCRVRAASSRAAEPAGRAARRACGSGGVLRPLAACFAREP